MRIERKSCKNLMVVRIFLYMRMRKTKNIKIEERSILGERGFVFCAKNQRIITRGKRKGIRHKITPPLVAAPFPPLNFKKIE